MAKRRRNDGEKLSNRWRFGDFDIVSTFLKICLLCLKRRSDCKNRLYSVRRKKWKVGRDNRGATGPYAYSDATWVSYDDATSVKDKVSPVLSPILSIRNLSE